MSTIANNLTSRLLRSSAASILALGVLTCTASAGVDVSITGEGFAPIPIRVISEDGKSWTKVKDGDLILPVTIGLGMTDRTIYQYMVRQIGQPEGERIGFAEYTADNTPIRLDFSAPYPGSTTHLSAERRQEIVAGCNTNLNKGKGIHETHNMFTGVGVELRGNFIPDYSKRKFEFATAYAEWHSGSGNVTVPVKCEAATAKDVVAKTPDFQVRGIHLRFMTTAGYPTRPNPATKCQMSQAKVRLETSKAGAVKFKLWTKVGNQPMQNQFVEAWSKFVGPGKYEATFTKNFTVDKTTPVQAMAEDLTNPIGQSTGWKEVKLDCTGAGGGGFAGTPSTSNPDGLPQANPKAPFRVVPGIAVGTKVAPIPPRPAPQTRPHLGRAKTAPTPHAVAAKDRFYPSRIRVN